MPAYLYNRTMKFPKNTKKVLHVLTRVLHPNNKRTEHSMVVCSCFDGLRSVGVFTGRYSELKEKISEKFLDTYDKIVYT